MKIFLFFLFAIMACMFAACSLEDHRERESARQWMEFSASHKCHIKTVHKSPFAGEQRDLYECEGFEILH